MQVKKYIVSLGLIGLATLGGAQTKVGLMNNGVRLVLKPNTYLRVVGDVTIQNSGQIVNNGTITLGGNFTQLTKSSYKDTTNSWIRFMSTVEQTLKSDDSIAIAISNLSVKNQNGLTLQSHLAIKEGVELLPNNKVKLGNFNVNLAKDIQYYQKGATNYFVTNGKGYVQQVVGNRPTFFYVGNSTYNPMELFNTGVMDTFEIRVIDTAPLKQADRTVSKDKAVKRIWELGRHATHSYPFIGLELYWSAAEELPNLDKTKTMIQFWGALGSPFPYISPAQTKNNLWMVNNDLIQLLTKVNEFWIEEPDSINAPPAPKIKVQPNPAENEITLSTSAENVGKDYHISDMGGNIVKTGKIVSQNQTIDISNQPAGTYFMNIGPIGTSRSKFVKV